MSFVTELLVNLVRVGVRRARRGPFHPAWGILLETTVETLRAASEVQLRGTIEAWRAGQEKSAATTPPARGVTIRERRLAGRPALELVPRDWRDSDGTILYFHGGGYCTGSPRTHRTMVSHIVAASNLRAIIPDYRLAPEHPFPAAIDDAVACLRALYAEGVAPERLALAGDSAGGGLSLVTMMQQREDKLPQPACAVLLCPWGDLEGSFPSMEDNAKYDWGDRRTLDFYALRYAPGKLRDPRVSPIHASLVGLPPLLIQSGDAEVLRDEIRVIVGNARRDGVRVEAHEYPGMVHDFQLFAPLVPQSKAAIDEIAEYLRRSIR